MTVFVIIKQITLTLPVSIFSFAGLEQSEGRSKVHHKQSSTGFLAV